MDDPKIPDTNSVGAPRRELNYSELKKLMQFKPSLRTTAGWFDVSESTLKRRIQEYSDNPDMNFEQFRDKYLGPVKIALQQKCVQLALGGSERMLIWTTKNLCGWADQQDLTITDGEIKIVTSGKDMDL